MSMIAAVVFWLLLALALVQTIFGCRFAWLLLRQAQAPAPDTKWPKAGILLSLRGADPQLADSVRRLMTQNYADYELHIVVDSVNDPAWSVVRGVQQELGDRRLHLFPLAERRTTCGLQCSAFVQAMAGLEPDVEVVVTVDGDLIPHPDWLRELIQPLLDERVGAAFGNRWFMPQRSNWGSLVRYLWNVAAVVPMYVFSIPWGGCFAVRRAALEESGLLDDWPKSIVHDGPVKSRLDRLGLQVRFVPSLMMVIRERCSLPFCHDFLKRQLMWTRLYHPNWSRIVFHAAATTGIWLVAAVLAVWAAWLHDPTTGFYAIVGIAIYWTTMLVLVGILEYSVRCVLCRRGEATGWWRWNTWLKLPAAIPLTQAIYFLALLEATFRRRVSWRGVTYLLGGPLDITLLQDRPFEQTSSAAPTQASL